MGVPDSEVILLHGLWFRGWAMFPIGRRLRKAGFDTRAWSYSTTHQDLESQAEKLYRFALRADGSMPNFIAHSLGGLIIVQMLLLHPETPCGRVVLLGSPLQGSSVAKRLSAWPGGRIALGEAERTLIEGVRAWPGDREIGMIAGTRSVGLGLLAGGAGHPGDGTVLSKETRHEALTDHIELPVSHTSMLFSKAAARQAGAFLRRGRFEHGS